MRDVLGPGTILGYCTNVHAGTTLEAIRTNLERYAVPVKARVSPDQPMGVGQWFPAAAARALRAPGQARAHAAWMAERGLVPFTLNGFPYGDFHGEVVKHAVYRPDWTDPARLEYTIDLLHVLAGLVGPGGEGSVSTVPIGWREGADPGTCERAAAALRAAAREAARLEAERGVLLHLDLEPEPGCVLDRAGDVVEFFTRYLLGGDDDATVRRHVGVCHDVCHAAVMFEDQGAVLDRYDAAGIRVGKVQLSSAVRVAFDGMDAAAARTARDQLAAFREPRYLHQAVVRDPAGGLAFHDDLPAALGALAPDAAPAGEWRVHFHVPVFLERAGAIGTTQDEVAACLALLRERPGPRHFEVETYAWDVLPAPLRTDDLADGIAREIEWIQRVASSGDQP